MKVLVVGGGGREHALAWKLAQSPKVTTVFVAPGNAGTDREPKVSNLPIAAEDIDGLARFAAREAIDLTLVGPENPLVAGIADHFEARGLACFGPKAAAARLEGSKAFAKEFLLRHGIPTARHRTFNAPAPAKAYIEQQTFPLVVKADGLAGGKGVIIAQTPEEAVAATTGMLSGEDFGAAGRTVVVEEYLQGEEASFIVMVDGRHILPLATSQDHKARDDGDRGPNTGGMGAYSPAPVVTEAVYDFIMRRIIQPTVDGLAAEGQPYLGFLYAGVMIDSLGTAKVLEFNCRFGDPETQPILLRLRSDLMDMCLDGLAGRLDRTQVQWDRRAALGVVMAAGGYPFDYPKGQVISGLDAAEEQGLKVFHAGTSLKDGRIVTSGGRVLCVAALGETVRQAQARAYARVREIDWPGVYYRRDIGYRAVAREST